MPKVASVWLRMLAAALWTAPSCATVSDEGETELTGGWRRQGHRRGSPGDKQEDQ
jgi:hypothetical protein